MKKEFLQEVFIKDLQNLINEVGEFNYNKSFTPTDAMARKAKETLAQLSSGALSTGTNEGSGRQKAEELVQKKTQNVNQMKKMAAFFSKHAADVVRIKQQGGPKTEQEQSIINAWNLHGGEEGNRWVKSELQRFHDENLRTKSNLRKAGGAGINKGMGVFDTSIMKTNKQRIHR